MSATYTPGEESYAKKVEEAKAAIGLHNDQLPDDSRLNWDQILSEIKKLGGTTDSALQEMTWEDLEDCGIPRVLARKIAKGFRAKPVESPKVPGKSAIRQMGVLELLRRYDPTSDNNHVIQKALIERTDAHVKFIVFDSNNTVDAELSYKLWTIYKDTGIEGPISNVGGGIPRRTHRIGETPSKKLDENPLIKQRPLIDGVCDRSGINWAPVPLGIRQFVRVVCDDTGCFEEVADMRDFFERLEKMATSAGNWNILESLASRYPDQWVIYEELRDDNRLPSLVIKTGNGSSKHNNPFGSHKEF